MNVFKPKITHPDILKHDGAIVFSQDDTFQASFSTKCNRKSVYLFTINTLISFHLTLNE